jgi:hypothetical protein
MLAWCSNYSEEGNARHTRRKEGEINVQERCFSRQQHVAISGRAMENRAAVCWEGRVLKMLQLPLNIVFFISFYLHCLSCLTFVFLLPPFFSFFVDVPLCTRRRIRQNKNLLELLVYLLSPTDSSSRNNTEDTAEMGAGGSRRSRITGLVAGSSGSEQFLILPKGSLRYCDGDVLSPIKNIQRMEH